MSVLVTGGLGYIGPHVVAALRGAGEEVVVLDGRERSGRTVPADAPVVIGDVGDRHLVAATLSEHQVDAVVHLAALKSVEESTRRPLRYYRENFVASWALLQAMADVGVRRLVFSSSAAVYGSPLKSPVSEDDAPRPESPYGETKLAVEHMLRWTSSAGDVAAVSLRYFNAAGAGRDGTQGEESESATSLVPIVMRVAAGQLPALEIYGSDYPTPDGTPVRDYVHVIDVARAHVAALQTTASTSGHSVYNIGTGTGVSVMDVVRATERMTGRRIEHVFTARRPGDPPAIWADVSRARRELGWRAVYDLDEIVRTAWLWQQRETAR
jgi:UDP-glucose 4-epimerase